MQREIIYIDCEPSQNISQKESVGYESSNKMLFNIQESLNSNIKRKLTIDEKEYICDFLKINPCLDFDMSVNILNNIKNDIMDQLKDRDISLFN